VANAGLFGQGRDDAFMDRAAAHDQREAVPTQNHTGGVHHLAEIDVNIPRDTVGVVARGGGSGVVTE
jgi:hypothetical protein